MSCSTGTPMCRTASNFYQSIRAMLYAFCSNFISPKGATPAPAGPKKTEIAKEPEASLDLRTGPASPPTEPIAAEGHHLQRTTEKENRKDPPQD
ncbi:hypothetical protein NDU88_001047 [Pleurodeles waltl]|uniref:Uncharacterized protein n=1 Tax=Pleurodeles waltl TaxID=8319 RepID=A0AAV7SYH1_PLEWA|nr:hypothetical protein NDU88_001047 [Pleurodeles waltl]